MLARLLRILFGFALACLAAAVTLVAFVYAPADLSTLSDDLNGDRLSEAGLFAMLITPHVLISAAFPAMLAAAYAETRKMASWPFYALVGLATAGLGFLAQYLTEPPTRVLSILQTYALIAFLTAGLIGGLVYWAFSGRFVPTAKSP